MRQSRGPRKSETTTTSERWRAMRVRAAERVAERGRPDPAGRGLRLVAQGGEQPDEADASLADRAACAGSCVAEGERAEAVAAAGGEVADGDRHALGDVRLAAVGGAEAHRRGGVEHEPGDEHALGEVDAHVRLAGAGGDVPVDPADVVARDVRADQRELGAVAEERRAVVAGEHAPPSGAPIVTSSARSSRSGIGPGPGRAARARDGARSTLTPRSSPRGRAAAIGHGGEDALEDRVRGHLLRQRLVGEHEPVAERVERERVQVLERRRSRGRAGARARATTGRG